MRISGKVEIRPPKALVITKVEAPKTASLVTTETPQSSDFPIFYPHADREKITLGMVDDCMRIAEQLEGIVKGFDNNSKKRVADAIRIILQNIKAISISAGLPYKSYQPIQLASETIYADYKDIPTAASWESYGMD